MIFRSALLVAALCAVVTLASSPPTTTDLIEAQGYGVKSYEAYTDDGMFRVILNRFACLGETASKPIFGTCVD